MLYLIWKEPNISSLGALKKFQKQIHAKKIGHYGTLDPLAEGLLLVATNQDTKWFPYLEDDFKTYQVTFVFGQSTSSYDKETFATYCALKIPSKTEISNYFNNLTGPFWQLPPAYSARKVDGQRAYILARQGKEPTLRGNFITIKNVFDLDFENYSKHQEVTLSLEVSRGTYIRSLVHQSALTLKSAAYMTKLKRVKLNSLSKANLGELKIENLLNYSKILINENTYKCLQVGKKICLNQRDNLYKVYSDETKEFWGIIKIKNKEAKALRLVSYN